MRRKTLNAAAIIQCAVILACTALALLYSIPLGLGILLTAVTCHWFNGEGTNDISKFEFYKLHDVPEYIEETVALVTSEWPSPVTEKGTREPNHVRMSSMKESCDSMPCHLVALVSCGERNEVAAHVVLRESPRSSRDLKRFAKMLKAGIPLAAVHQAMQVAGLAPPDLSSPEQPDQSETCSTKPFRTASVGNPRELKRYVRMLKAGLSVAAVHQAMQVAGLAPPDLFSPEVPDHSPPSYLQPTAPVTSLTEYKKFVVMLKAGVPAAAVQQAMQVAGLNPSDLFQPDTLEQSATSPRETFGQVNEHGHKDFKIVAKMFKAGVAVEAVGQVMQAADFVTSDLPTQENNNSEISSEKEIGSVSVATLNNKAKYDLVSGHERRQGPPQALDRDLKRFRRMLKAGVPVAAAQQAMQIAGLEPLEVISPEVLDKLAPSSKKDAEGVSIASKTPNSSHEMKRFVKMLKAGVPVAAVQQAVQVAGLVSPDVATPDKSDQSATSSKNPNRRVSFCILAVFNRYVKMLKAGVPVAAVEQAMQVAGFDPLSGLSDPEKPEQLVTSSRKTSRSATVLKAYVNRFVKMLKAGVPVAAVQQAMRIAGLNLSDLSSPEELEQSVKSWRKTFQYVAEDGGKDLRRFTKMLKAVVPVAAVRQAMQLAGIVPSYLSSHEKSDQSEFPPKKPSQSVTTCSLKDLRRFTKMLRAGVPVAAVEQAMQIALLNTCYASIPKKVDLPKTSSEKEVRSVNNKPNFDLVSGHERRQGPPQALDRDLKRFRRMLKAGVPVAAVQQAMQIAGLEPLDVISSEDLDKLALSSEKDAQSVTDTNLNNEATSGLTSCGETVEGSACVSFRKKPNGNRDLKRFVKMLKAGVPVAAVQQAMRIAGLNLSDLSSPEELEQSVKSWRKTFQYVAEDGGKDLRRFTKMLKAVVPVAAVRQAMQLAGIVPSYLSSHEKSDQSEFPPKKPSQSVTTCSLKDLRRFTKMLRAGVPVAAVEQAMQIALLNTCYVSITKKIDLPKTSSEKEVRSINNKPKSDLLSGHERRQDSPQALDRDLKRFRRMLKAGVPVAAVQQAMQIAGLEPLEVISPEDLDKLAPSSKKDAEGVSIASKTPNSSHDMKRFVKMLKAGVPVAAVQQAVQVAGLVSPDVATPDKSDQSATSSKNPNRRVSFCFLAVFNRYVKMLKAGVPVAAVEQAMQLSGLNLSDLPSLDKPDQLGTSGKTIRSLTVDSLTVFKRFVKMLKAGVPVAAVQQAMQVAVLRPSVPVYHGMPDQSATSSGIEVPSVTVSSLVVKPEFRGQGLGKAICAFAVQVASGLGLGVTEANGACRDKLVPFYEELGARKRSAEKRKGIPKVRLGNEMSIRIDSVVRDKAEKVLASFIGK